jgi:hypothetical protein
MLDRRRWRLPDADPATVFCVDWHLRSSFSLGIGCRHPHCAATLPAPHRQNTAPKSQPPNPRGEIFRHRVEETTGKNVSAAKKIACDPKKVPAIRSGFLTSAAARGASLFKMMDISRHKSVDVLRGYVRDAEAFRDHAGAGLL